MPRTARCPPPPSRGLVLQHCPSNCHTHRCSRSTVWRGIVQDARPRVSLLSRAAAHGNGLRRADRYEVDPARPEDGHPDTQHEPCRLRPGSERCARRHATHQDRDPGIAELDLRADTADKGEEVVAVSIVVRRWGADARRDRQQLGQLLGHLQATLTRYRNSAEAHPTGRDGASRARTGDLLIANQALSQLSYSPGRGQMLAPGGWLDCEASALRVAVAPIRRAVSVDLG